ncbi:MAG: hypothetical protein JST84_10785 [Acidobacteria bacterium]|nr:hypothetical protein [Acidobacteriota bacterium]
MFDVTFFLYWLIFVANILGLLFWAYQTWEKKEELSRRQIALRLGKGALVFLSILCIQFYLALRMV